MLYTYQECLATYGSAYQIRAAVHRGDLRYLCRGIYADQEHVSELALITLQYPHAVFTMKSAFYYHGLTDVIPTRYDLATDRNAAKIRNDKVVQYFYPSSFFTQGITEMNFQCTLIRIYSKERMLIELLRYRTKMPFDDYKEIVRSYRKILPELDIEAVETYAREAPRSSKILEILQREIF